LRRAGLPGHHGAGPYKLRRDRRHRRGAAEGQHPARPHRRSGARHEARRGAGIERARRRAGAARHHRQRKIQRAAAAAGKADPGRGSRRRETQSGRRRLRARYRQGFDGVTAGRRRVMRAGHTSIGIVLAWEHPHGAYRWRRAEGTMARILVVEDENLLAMQITWMLEDAGHFVVGPERSVEATTKVLARQKIDLTLLDAKLVAV